MPHFNNRDRYNIALKEHITEPRRSWKDAGKVHTRGLPTNADLRALWRNPPASHTRGRTKSAKYKHIYRKSGRWQATFKYDQQTRYIGVFDTEDEAARAHDLYILDNDLPDFLLIGVNLDDEGLEKVS